MEQEVRSFLDDPMLDKHLERIQAWNNTRAVGSCAENESTLQSIISETEDFISTRTQDCHPFWVGMAYINRLEALCRLAEWDPNLVQPDHLRVAATAVQCLPKSLEDFCKVLRVGFKNDKYLLSLQEHRIYSLTYEMDYSPCWVKEAEDIIKEASTRATDKAYDEAMAAVQNRMAGHSIQEDMNADEAMDAEED